MSIHSDNPEHGFQFPGDFELSAMALADSAMADRIVGLLARVGVIADPDSVRERRSSKGTYVSVSVAFRAHSREELDVAHATLRELPEVKWTL